MASYFIRESFFRPPLHASRHSVLPAPVYNALELLLVRHRAGSLFVPIRTMQYQAVVDREEIIFVDNQGGYAHQDGEGGRLIQLAWRPRPAAQRDSLSDPVPCEIEHYFPGLEDVERRLMSEFPPVLQQILQRQRQEAMRTVERRVVALRPPGRSKP